MFRISLVDSMRGSTEPQQPETTGGRRRRHTRQSRDPGRIRRDIERWSLTLEPLEPRWLLAGNPLLGLAPTDASLGLDAQATDEQVSRSEAGRQAGDDRLFYWAGGQRIDLLAAPDEVVVGRRDHEPLDPSALQGLTRSDGPLAGGCLSVRGDGRTVVLALRTDLGRPALGQPVARAESLEFPDELWSAPVFRDPDSGLRQMLTDELLVRLRPETSPNRFFDQDLYAGYRPLPGTNDTFIATPAGGGGLEALELANSLVSDPRVVWAAPDFYLEIAQTSLPNDPLFGKQWNMRNTGQTGAKVGADANLVEAWDTTTGSQHIVVAVIDEGVEMSHPDLEANIFTNGEEIADKGIDDDQNGWIDDVHGWDFYDNDSNPGDAGSHGTAVAGIVAASRNETGVTGTAPNVQIMPIRLLNGRGALPIYDSDYDTEYIRNSSIASAIYYAGGRTADGTGTWRGADVVNMSFFVERWHSAINDALNWTSTNGRGGLGTPIFVSSGNFAYDYQEWVIDDVDPSNIDELDRADGTWSWEVGYATDEYGAPLDSDNTVRLGQFLDVDGTVYRFESLNEAPDGWDLNPPEGGKGWTIEDDPSRAYGTARYQARASSTIGDNDIAYIRAPQFTVEGDTIPGITAWIAQSSEKDDKLVFRLFNHETKATYVVRLEDGRYQRPRVSVSYPALLDSTIAVGASTDWDYRAHFSQYGAALDFVAPGGGGNAGITTTDLTGDRGYNETGDSENPPDTLDEVDYTSTFSGTSAAAPLAAGIAALMLSQAPNLSADDVRQIMRNTADKIGKVDYVDGFNRYYGYGRVNATTALAATPVDNDGPTLDAIVLIEDDEETVAGDMLVGDVVTHDPTPIVEMRFNERTVRTGGEVTVTAPDGSTITPIRILGSGTIKHRLFLPPLTQNGVYTVALRDSDNAADPRLFQDQAGNDWTSGDYVVHFALEDAGTQLSANTVAEDAPDGTPIGTLTAPDLGLVSVDTLALLGDKEQYFQKDEGRVNVYQATSTRILTNIEVYLYLFNSSRPTTVDFAVYESTADIGPYALVFSTGRSFASGEGYYSSGPINVRLDAGKYYMIGASVEGSNFRFYKFYSTPVDPAFGTVIGRQTIAYPPASTVSTTVAHGPYALQRLTTEAVPSEVIELTDDAGGRFKLEGFELQVADQTLLDYESATTHTITTRTTDREGNTFDKEFVVHVTDVDVSVQAKEIDVAESGPGAQYTIALDTVPSSPVEITATTDGQSLVYQDGLAFGSPWRTSATYVFTDQTPRTIEVMALDDSAVEGQHTSIISHAITASDDSDYPLGLPIDSVVVNIADNDFSPGVTIAPMTANVSESGGTDTYAVALNTIPSGPVEITVTADEQSLVSVGGLAFGSPPFFHSVVLSLSDRTPIQVEVAAVDDLPVEGPHAGIISHAVTASADPDYPLSLPIDPVTVHITDNDQLGGLAGGTGTAGCTTEGDDGYRRVAVDASGQYYAVGTVASNTGDIVVVKYGPTGTAQWEHCIGGDFVDRGEAIAVDAMGNVYVVGGFNGVVDFDPDPSQQWLETNTGPRFDVFVLKLNRDGVFQWVKTFGQDTLAWDIASGVAVQPNGDVMVAGTFGGTVQFSPGSSISAAPAGGQDMFLLRLDGQGEVLWVTTLGGDGDEFESPTALHVDPLGGVYVGGYFSGTVADFDRQKTYPDQGDPDLIGSDDPSSTAFLAKYDAAGTLAWVRPMGAAGGNFEDVTGIAVDPQGDVTITGKFQTSDADGFDPGDGVANRHSQGGFDIYVTQFGDDGTLQWDRQFGGSGADGGRDITADGEGNLLAAGFFQHTLPLTDDITLVSQGGDGLPDLDAGDGYLLGIDSAGGVRWGRRFGGVGDDRVDGINVDSLGNAYLAGFFSDVVEFDLGDGQIELQSTGGRDAFAARIAVSPPPEVVDVLIRGSMWDDDSQPISIFDQLDPLRPLPWINLDQIHVVFDQDVEVAADSLTLVGLAAPYRAAGFTYDRESSTATWTFDDVFGPDRFLLNLAGEATDSRPIHNKPGDRLLLGGSDFLLRFDVLPGDCTRDGVTSVTDLANVAMRVGATSSLPGNANYDAIFDVNGDGAITVTDLVDVGVRVASRLPEGEPVLPTAPLAADGEIASSPMADVLQPSSLQRGTPEAVDAFFALQP